MNKTFDQSKDGITKLCQYFKVNRQSFFAPAVKEANVRSLLIDPFFEILGWDVHNNRKFAPQYTEVISEDSLDVEGHQKRPDYTFRVGTLPKFYAEAKKCGVNINVDLGPAYQLRRYAFSARLALSILTDFEELSIYECSSRPKPSDKASHSRIMYFCFDEYADHWRTIWDIFSREAVWSGSFDQYITSKRKRGTSEVDTEFLKDIERWREELARNLALRNSNLTVDELNSSVQLIIDRIVFLRIAEDRGLEPYEQLLKLCDQSDIYRNFITKLCRKADDKYNSGLFHFQKESGISDVPDTITPRLTIDDKIIKPIIQNLYFEFGSPYHFGVLPVEILGTVYERFLGKVIRLTAGHQAKVEEKPEVRKAGGVYYTPSYIVDYIVKNTVGKQVEGKSPAQIAKGRDGQPIRILDMACGSGSFLLGAYQYLLDHYLKWYELNQPEKHPKAVFQDTKGIWRLTISERKRILTTHIFGVDIDHQAVEVTKLSLLIKALEGENDVSLSHQMQIFQERALPNLSNNIKCGNSLIGPDCFAGNLFSDAEELSRVNPFDWEAEYPEAMREGGFDCVIGNPPYVLGRETFDYATKQYLSTHYESFGGKYDLYIYFTERAISLLSEMGRLGYILPNTILANENAAALRKIILDKTQIALIRLFNKMVFRNAQVESVIIAATRQKSDGSNAVLVETNNMSYIPQCCFLKDTKFRYNINANPITDDLIDRIQFESISLGSISDICIGIQLGGSSGADTKQQFLSTSKKTVAYKRVLDGRDINRYAKNWAGQYVRYGEWLHRKRNEKYFLNPKLMFRQIGKIPVVSYDDEDFYTLNTIYNLISSSHHSLKYLLGIINSRLGAWFWLQKNEDFKAIFPKIKKSQIEAVPIHPINFSDPIDNAKHDKMVALVEQMFELHKRKAALQSAAEQQQVQRIIDATDELIDTLVYELYGLTQKEIEIVESANI